MNDEGVVALLGLAILTLAADTLEVRVPAEVLEAGLPDNSGVQVFKDELTDELVIKIAKHDTDGQ